MNRTRRLIPGVGTMKPEMALVMLDEGPQAFPVVPDEPLANSLRLRRFE